MGTVSITSSAGEKFIISFSNSNSYNLDELLAAKSRTSQKALVIEVRKNETIAKKALKQLEIDLTKNITDALGREEVVNNVNDIITSVYNVYGREGNSSAFAVQLINAKITTYLKEVVGRDDISFDISIYDNRANISYKLPDSFIDGQFVEYYERFCQSYKQNTSVCTGGLAITDEKCSFDVTRSDYVSSLLGGASTDRYYGTGGHTCSDLHVHQCSPDRTCHDDLHHLGGNSDGNISQTLINELKRLFVTKKSQSEKIESRYIKADIGLFRSVKIEEDLKMNNIITDGTVSGNEIRGYNVVTNDLKVTSGTITLSDDNTSKYYQLAVDPNENALVLTGVVDGKAIRHQLMSIDVTELDDGYLFYNHEDGCFYTRPFEFLADDGKISLDSMPDEVKELLSVAATKTDIENLKDYTDAKNKIISDTISKIETDLQNYYTKEQTDAKISEEIGKQVHFGIEICDVLPDISEGKTGTVYLVPDENSISGVYTEYVFVAAFDDKEAHFEKIGTTKIDLTNYYDKTTVDNKLDEIRSEIDSKGYLTSIPEEYVTDGELTDRVYTKSEVEALIAAVQTHVENTYVTQEVINNYATTEQVTNVTQQVEQVETKITEVENNVTEVVKEQVQTEVKEVITGDTSQVESIKYLDFDELEG